jgi:hypothetical protein
MTEETKVEVELHDEEINDIVEETLEEAAPAAKGAKGDEGAVTEPESIASVDKAADAVKSQAPVPKTKAGMINAMFTKMNGMSKAEMSKMYASYMGEGVEVEEGAEEVVAETIDTTAELNALVESEATLSDEFKAKTAVIFEAAVKTKLSEEVERIEDQYKSELAEEVSSIKEDLVGKVDSYLNYVVETWMEENKVAVQNGLRTEIAETFMNKMKDLFVESYIEVPESKLDLVDELAEQVEELEGKLNTQTGDNIKLAEQLEVLQRDAIIAEATRGMAETQVEKLRGMVESVDFDDEESFKTKVQTVKESFFKTEKPVVSEELTAEEPETEIEVSSVMEQYLAAIKKTTQSQ